MHIYSYVIEYFLGIDDQSLKKKKKRKKKARKRKDDPDLNVLVGTSNHWGQLLSLELTKW